MYLFDYLYVFIVYIYLRFVDIALLPYDIYSIIFYETQIEFFIASNYENLLQNVDV